MCCSYTNKYTNTLQRPKKHATDVLCQQNKALQASRGSAFYRLQEKATVRLGQMPGKYLSATLHTKIDEKT